MSIGFMIALRPPKAEVRGSNSLGCANHFYSKGLILSFYDFG